LTYEYWFDRLKAGNLSEDAAQMHGDWTADHEALLRENERFRAAMPPVTVLYQGQSPIGVYSAEQLLARAERERRHRKWALEQARLMLGIARGNAVLYHEAEQRAQKNNELYHHWRIRAQAAEARVKELEEVLTSMLLVYGFYDTAVNERARSALSPQAPQEMDPHGPVTDEELDAARDALPRRAPQPDALVEARMKRLEEALGTIAEHERGTWHGQVAERALSPQAPQLSVEAAGKC